MERRQNRSRRRIAGRRGPPLDRARRTPRNSGIEPRLIRGIQERGSGRRPVADDWREPRV